MIPIVLELGSREEKHALGFNELGAKTIYCARAQAWEGDAASAGSCPDEALAEIIEELVEKRKVVRDDRSTPRDHPLSGAKGDDGENLARRATTDRRIVLQMTQLLTQRLIKAALAGTPVKDLWSTSFVRSVEAIEDEFHARHSATARRYAYRLTWHEDPMLGRFAWRPRARPAPEALDRATRAIEGERDVLESRVRERTQLLEQSEARFRSLNLLSSDWFWEQDAAYRFILIAGHFQDASAPQNRVAFKIHPSMRPRGAVSRPSICKRPPDGLQNQKIGSFLLNLTQTFSRTCAALY